MRWHILKTLIHKEFLRHTTNRGGMALAGLLVAAALVLSALNPGKEDQAQFVGGIHHFYIHAPESDAPWIGYLRKHVPKELEGRIIFAKLPDNLTPNLTLNYDIGTAGIQLRTQIPEGNPYIWICYPSGDRNGMTPYEKWFWRNSYDYFRNRALEDYQKQGIAPPSDFPEAAGDNDLWAESRLFADLRRFNPSKSQAETVAVPSIKMRETALHGSTLDMHAAIATALVVFALFFSCVYLMPSMTCEERERGLLLAQALSPASALEILTAKFFFYPTFGILLAAILAGIHNTSVLASPFFWMTILTLAVGTLGIGMTIASLARTQRSASLSALCYMLVVALVLLICQQNNIPYVPTLALEYHAPHILHATLTNQIHKEHWFNLLGCVILSCCWASAAVILFGKRGWQ